MAATEIGVDLLLPLRGVAGQQRMCENVRVGKVRFAVVGYLLRATQAQGDRNRFWSKSTIAASGSGRACTNLSVT
jgi:hypothetical protein